MRGSRFLAFLALLPLRVAACPTCADAASAGPGGNAVWFATGAFLLVPPLLAGAALLLLRPLLARKKDEDLPDTPTESNNGELPPSMNPRPPRTEPG